MTTNSETSSYLGDLISTPENISYTSKSIVRLRTSYWKDRKGAYTRKDLTVLSRKSVSPHIFKEELDATGARSTLDSIVNLYEVPDGIYEVVPVNFTRDWETGYVDGYDLKLIPYNEPSSSSPL